MNFKQIPAFFAGASTPDGFVSYFDNLYKKDYPQRVYILKGGPGTGKSTLMKKLAAILDEKGEKYELFYCSSDPRSLDAVRIVKNGTVIMDGTSPHTMDPIYPGASEVIINLGECFDADKLFADREKIIELSKENKKCHNQAKRYINAAGSLIEDTETIGLLGCDLPKADAFAKRLAYSSIPVKKHFCEGSETKRFLSAITPDGLTVLSDSVSLSADEVYVIEDRIGAAVGVIISAVKNIAVSRGYDVISLMCPLSNGKREHLIIPELSLAFCTSNQFHKIEPKGHRIIHARRFFNTEFLSSYRERITFNKKAAGELIKSASLLLKKANEIHAELEKHYISAMDFKKLDRLSEDLLKKITAQL